MAVNQITGRSAFLSLLKDDGVTHLFGNPGTTELPIMHALKDHPDMTYVMALQESLVVAMADGYSRATGELVACNVHVAPGLGNAMGSLFNCKFTGTPLIITAGQQEIGHGLTEPLLYDSLVPIAQPLVKWAVEVNRLEDLPRIIRRAAKIATTPPTGPVFISLPGDILNNEAGIELGQPTRINTRTRPADDVIAALAERILKAENPMIICGDEIVKSGALDEAAEFAAVLGAPAFQQTIPFGAHFLSEHPCFLGTLSRNQGQVRKVLDPYDLMIVLGADVLRMSVWSEAEPMPPHLPILQIGLVDWEIGKNYPTELAVGADVRETLVALTPALRELGGATLAETAKSRMASFADDNWTAKRARLIEKLDDSKAETTPLDPDWMIWQLTEALPEDAIVVNEGVTSTAVLNNLLPYRDRYGFHGNGAGGIGWGIAAAVGVQLAHPDRPVCAIIGDGSAMYSIQSLWTAANQKMPVNFVICDNGGYRIIKQRLLSFHGNDQFVGMDFKDPPIDFVGLAQSMGVSAVRVTEPAELRPALDAAFANKSGPNLIDLVCDGSVG